MRICFISDFTCIRPRLRPPVNLILLYFVLADHPLLLDSGSDLLYLCFGYSTPDFWTLL